MNKTVIQNKADEFDLELYRVILKVESVYDEEPSVRRVLGSALNHLRAARPFIRSLMRDKDMKATA